MRKPPPKRPPRERYPGLARLCGSYLHEDLAVTDGSVDAALARFAREVAPAVRSRCVADLTRVLSEVRGERALEAVLEGLDCAHRPRGGRQAARAWLERVLHALRTTPR